MSYSKTLDYLYSRLPMFHRIGSAAYKANLDNTIAICKLLGNPENKFKSIHIAGTNGKGSTSHMIASVLQSAGYKTGLYTSPHLKDFRERIKINGKMIPKQYIVKFVEQYKNDFERIEPSFFEWTVGLAFDYFAKQKVDVAVIEVGLGGRLDSTNVITPELSLITNISYDHMALLGDTLPKIAAEKAGIIKPGIPVVIGEAQGKVKDVFVERAKTVKAPVYFAAQEYKVENIRTVNRKAAPSLLCTDITHNKKILYKDLECELAGMYQRKNIPAVIKAIDLLNGTRFNIPEKALRAGISSVVSQTGLLGRWQIISRKPLTIADTGHNEAGMKEVLAQLEQTPHKKLHFVLGMVNDKDISKILSMLPKDAVYYFCRPVIPRGLDQEELRAQASAAGLKGESYASVAEALKYAQREAKPGTLVFVGGSTFVVAEVV
jgi:dihydrofolate synthase/folylpolyglutamate synthase